MNQADIDGLRELVQAGANRRDSDKSVIEELGFVLGLWNGDRDVPVGLAVTCGGWTEARGLMNSFSLNLPMPVDAAELYELESGLCAMRAVVASWEPDWATMTTHALASALDAAPRTPTIGWITYLDSSRAVPADVPVALREELRTGTLLVSANRAEAADLATVTSLAEALRSTGAIRPTP